MKPKTRRLKLNTILIILISLLVVYAVVNRIWLQEWRAQLAAEKGIGNYETTRSSSGIPVNVLLLKPETIDETIIVSGSLSSNEQTDLRSESSGKITDIKFVEGSKVKKGDLLVKINDKDLQAQHERAIHRQKLAEDKERRQAILLEKEAISQEEYDIVLTELNSLKAETELIMAQIEHTEIRAPFDGVVGLRNVSVGEYISPSINVARIVNNDPIKIDFSIPEKYQGVIRPNSKITFKVQGNGKDYQATVYAVDPKIDISTRTIQMRAIAPNPDGQLFPGTSARIYFSLTSVKDALMVPAEALVSEASGPKAYVYNNGVSEMRSVETDIRTERYVQVTRGLSQGDTLIVSGILQLRPDSKVRINNLN